MMAKGFKGWFGLEGKMLVEQMHKKSRPIIWYTDQRKARRRVCLT